MARRATGAAMPKIPGQRLAHVRGNRQAVVQLSFPAHQHLADIPMEILQAQGHHLPGPQAQPSQQQQDAVIALSLDGVLIATGQ